jgi:hypothetical protein
MLAVIEHLKKKLQNVLTHLKNIVQKTIVVLYIGRTGAAKPALTNQLQWIQ